jgi:hypothetical protein
LTFLLLINTAAKLIFFFRKKNYFNLKKKSIFAQQFFYYKITLKLMKKTGFIKHWLSFLLIVCLCSVAYGQQKKQAIVISRKDQAVQQKYNDAVAKYEKGNI